MGFMTVVAHDDIAIAIQGVLGTILCLGTKNKGPIPINKNLWLVT